MKKLCALILAMLMAFSMFAYAEEVIFPLAEPIEVTAYVCTGDSAYSVENTALYKWMEEKTNVKLKVEYSTNLAENGEKLNVLLNTGDYPDVLFKSGIAPETLLDLGKQGIFVQLDELIEQYAPNYSAIITERGDWPAVTSADGHIYSMYEISKPNTGNTPMYTSTSSGLKILIWKCPPRPTSCTTSF